MKLLITILTTFFISCSQDKYLEKELKNMSKVWVTVNAINISNAFEMKFITTLDVFLPQVNRIKDFEYNYLSLFNATRDKKINLINEAYNSFIFAEIKLNKEIDNIFETKSEKELIDHFFSENNNMKRNYSHKPYPIKFYIISRFVDMGYIILTQHYNGVTYLLKREAAVQSK